MSENGRNPLEELADAFLQRYRRGERPALTEYTQQHPELADEIRDLFPALVMMEEAGPHKDEAGGAFRGEITADGKALRRVGDYRILREVGRGGMGVVYEAVQESLGRHVALKVMPFEVASDPICLQRFSREARSAARLHHTNIVPVFEVGTCGGLHYFAMQFIQGQALDEVLVELRKMRRAQHSASASGHPGVTPTHEVAQSIADSLLTGRFAPGGENGKPPASEANQATPDNHAPPQAPDSALVLHSSSFSSGSQADAHYFRSMARVGLQVAEALAYAHSQKVLHRDIKPANLLLDLHGTVWVTDFGLAKDEGEDLTRTGDIVGTLRYLAPERFNGLSDARGDIYSLGLTLYELLTLRPAFDESDRGRLMRRLTQDEPLQPRRVDRRVPRDLETIVLKAIAKEPERRYQTARDLAEDLSRFLSDRPIQARRFSWREQSWRWARRNKGWAATAATVLGLLLFIAVGGVLVDFRLQSALTRVQAAEQEKTEKLWRSYLERARAERSSGRAGQRWEALKAIREAARIRVTSELRNEAVAALVLPDVEVAREWDGWPHDTIDVVFDGALERYARLDRQGKWTVCRLGSEGEQVLTRLPAHGRPPWGLRAMSPDGRFLVYVHSIVVGHGGTGVCVWNLDGACPAPCLDELPGSYISALVFRDDGRQLAVGGEDGVITIYDPAAGKLAQRLMIPGVPDRLAFDPQGTRLAVACGDTVRVFDVSHGRELTALRHPQKVTLISGLAWHPAGRRLASGCNDRKIHVWDVETAAEVMPPWTGHTDIGIDLAFNHAGDRVVSEDWSGQTRLWDARTGRLLLSMPGFACLRFSRDDRLLGCQREGQKLRLFRVAAGTELLVLRRCQADSGEQIVSSAIDSDGRVLGLTTSDWLTFFDLERGEELSSVRLPGNHMARLATFRAGGWFTEGNAGVLLWPMQAASSEQPTTLCIGPPRRVGPASVPGSGTSVDGRFLAVPKRDGAIVVDRHLPGRQVVVGPQSDVRRCALSPDGRWLVTGTFWSDGRYPSVRIWDARTGEPIHDLDGGGYIGTVVFSPDGKWLATGASGDIRLWEAGSWRPASRFAATSVVFSNDGRLLAVNDVLGAIRVLKPGTWQEVLRLTGPEPTWYTPTGFSSDGTRLLAIPKDQHAAYVWDLRQIREALKELDLDWEWPEFGPPSAPSSPLVARVDSGLLGPVFENQREAVAVFTLALAFQPLNAEAYYQRGLAYRRLEDTSKAVSDYGRFLALAPAGDRRRSEVQLRRATLYESLKDYPAALRDLHQLTLVGCDEIVWQEQFARLCNNVAWHYVMEGPSKEFPGQVLDLAEKARELGPYTFLFQNTLGAVYYRLGRYADAIGCLEEKLKKYPDYAAFDLYFLALSYQRSGKSGSARSCYERANAWWSANPGLPAPYITELTSLRAEAAAVLGLSVPVDPPSKNDVRASR